MCGRVVLAESADEIKRHFAFKVDDPRAADMPPRYNIAPTQPLAVIRNEDGVRRLRLVRWGLVPSWVKDPKAFSLIINARSETVLDKPSFRGGIRHRRCLIPVSGYYEWRRAEQSSQPFYISPSDGGLVALAGISEEWSGPDGNLIETAAVLTEPANAALGTIHHRMPVLVKSDHYSTWLDVRGVEPREALSALPAAKDNDWQFWPVTTRVNAVRNDDASLIEPLDEPDTGSDRATDTGSDQLDLF